MNNFLKITVQFFLKWFAKFYLWRTKPYVFVVAGTTGRHWLKEGVVDVLREKGLPVRGNQKNFNAEIGLPLSILGLPSGEGIFLGWFGILLTAVGKIFYPRESASNLHIDQRQSAYLVLEMAIDRPDNMKYLLSIVKPNAAVITAITMIYEENFEDLDEIAEEYKKLVGVLPAKGLAILNYDDRRVRGLASFTNAEVFTYGIDADWRGADSRGMADFVAKNIKKLPDGQSLEIHQSYIPRHTLFHHLSGDARRKTEVCEIKIPRFGRHHIYTALTKEIIRAKIAFNDFSGSRN